jgi:D-beta-D-heptose 7-phosphate kinase/D-beta-D-heptose 1-phosphate adenosyltransferase
VITELIQLLESFPGHRVMVLGDWMLDQYLYGDAERVSPEAPVPILRVVEREQRAGGSGSVAANLIALGLSVSCCGVVGRDARGETLIELLNECGADTAGLLTAEDRPTTTKTRVVGLAQHRHRQQLLRIDEEGTQPLNEASRRTLLDWYNQELPRCDLVCVQDYDKGVACEEIVQAVIRTARAASKPVLVDPAMNTSYEKYRGATLVTPNRNEFRVLAGRNCKEIETIGPVAAEITDRYELDGLAVTLDRDGAMLARRGLPPAHIPTKVRSVYDNTGAGDAVLAMLAGAVAAGADLEQAVRLANVAGGLEVEKFGCVPIPRGEVIADLRLEHQTRIGKRRTAEQLAAELKLLRDRGQTVVFTNGCFDLIHPGHIDFLSRCRALGHVLVVGLNSDASVRMQNKEGSRPFLNQEERAGVLSALNDVNYVVIFDQPDPLDLIRTLRPDVLVKGQDWAEKGVVGREFVESYGGRVELLPLLPGYSTTELARRISKGTSTQ